VKKSVFVLTLILFFIHFILFPNVAAQAGSDIGIYWDEGCSNPVTEIDWSLLYPGGDTDRVVFIRNEMNLRVNLSLDTANWQPPEAEQYINLSWNYTNQILEVNEVIPVTLNLSVDPSINGITDFSVDIVITGTEILDTEPPQYSGLGHYPALVMDTDPVYINVTWSDNERLDTVIIYENSTGVWEEHVCNLETGQCSGEILSYSFIVSVGITSTFISLLIIRVRMVRKRSKKFKNKFEKFLSFVIVILIIFLISLILFPEIPRNISRVLERLEIIPMAFPPKTFTHEIPASNLDVGEVVWYYSFANDTSGNWNETINKSFFVRTIFDAEPPKYWDKSINNTIAGKPTLFGLNWTDNVTLSGYIFSTNNTGEWVNSSFTSFSGTTNTSWNVTVLNDTGGALVQWRFYASDMSDNWNVSEIFTLKTIIQDTEEPNIGKSSFYPHRIVKLNQILNISSKITDNVLVNSTWMNVTKPDEGQYSVTPTELGEDVYMFNVTETDVVGRYNFSISAIDSSDNLALEYDHFYVGESCKLRLNFTDGDYSKINVSYNLTLHDEKETVEWEENDNIDVIIPGHEYDFFLRKENITINLMINISEDLSGIIIIDRLNSSVLSSISIPYSVVKLGYGVNVSFQFIQGSVIINYTDVPINEDKIMVYKCDDWNVSERSCSSSWAETSISVDKDNDLVEIPVSSFSGIVLVEYSPPTPTTVPSGDGDGNGDGGGGGGITVKSTGFYNFSGIVEVEVGSSKTVSGGFYSTVYRKNVIFNVTGIDESWFDISPSSLDEIKSKESVDVSITFSIPSYATLTTYPIEIIAKVGAVKFKKGLDLIVLAKSETTTAPPFTTTITTCALAGQACSSDSDCCYGYCCDNVCSDTECEEVMGFNTMYIVLIVIGVTVPTSYYIYKKYYKKKIPVKVKSVVPAPAPVRKPIPVVKPTVPSKPPVPPEVPLEVKFQRELTSLRSIIEGLKTEGYDVTEVEDELTLAENAFKKDLKDVSRFHLEKAKKILKAPK